MSTSIAELKANQHLPATEFGSTNLAKFFASHQKQIASVIPKHITPERMLRIAVNAISTTPTLAECSVESLVGAVVQSSILGLEPNTPLGQAYLVPFFNGKKQVKEVQFIPGYKGLIDLARRSGQIESVAAHAVYSNDEFEFEYGLEEKLRHVPAWDKERGDFIGAYAVAKFVDGGHAFEVMGVDLIEGIRDNSQGYQASQRFGFSSPWTDHFEEMARKTVFRRLAKWLPMSIEMQDAVALDNAAHSGTEQRLENALDAEFKVVDTSATQQQDFQNQLEAQGWYESPTGDKINVHGEVWNPEVHATGRENHGPVMNTDGTFRAKRGTAKKEPEEAPATKPVDNAQQETPPEEENSAPVQGDESPEMDLE